MFDVANYCTSMSMVVTFKFVSLDERSGDTILDCTDHFNFLWQRSRFENQIKQHNAKRAAMDKKVKSAESKGDDDEYSYEVSLDEDFLTSLEYGMPPASGMVLSLKLSGIAFFFVVYLLFL